MNHDVEQSKVLHIENLKHYIIDAICHMDRCQYDVPAMRKHSLRRISNYHHAHVNVSQCEPLTLSKVDTQKKILRSRR